MNKELEQELLKCVYGEFSAWDVCPSESPDFIFKKKGKTVLGSEVTELYHTESDARLKNIRNYSLDLITGGEFRHKDDNKYIKVDKVKYIKKGEKDGPKINAIIQEIPSFNKRVVLLTNTIKEKDRKVENYLKICPEVDLIINDASRFFRFDKYENFFFPFSRLINRNVIIKSKFREIYLVTTRQESFSDYSTVRIPLKLNLFAEDITIFEDLIRKHKRLNELKADNKIFMILFYCLYRYGYEDISVVKASEGIGLTIGSCLFLYTKKGKNIHEYITIPEQLPEGESINKVNNEITENELNIANELLENKKNFKCCMPLFMKAENV